MNRVTRTARVLPALLVLAGVTPAGAQGRPTPSATAPGGWDAYARGFDSLAAAGRVVGAATLLLRDGRVVARHDYGLADRTRHQPVDARTLFHYGSITKTLTAVAIMQLRDRGLLSLDDHITRWVPELRQVHDPYGMIDSITLRMLLSHSAGFQNGTWPYRSGTPWEPFEPTTWNQLVAMMPYQELHFRPGSRYSYSNPGYIYLARVIEAISGDPWEAYIQKNIFAPLGLDRSYFGGTPYYLADDRSNNYTVVRDSSGREEVHENGRDFDPGITIPNGGWNAPLTDLATWASFLTDATRGDSTLRRRYDVVLARASLAEMWRPVIPTGAPGSSLGLGFFLQQDAQGALVGHTGSQAGFLSFLWINPATATAIIAVLNTATDVPGARSPLGEMMTRGLALIRGGVTP
jgi:CubicO group peptidase (beta-lactamase class C family)